MPLARAVEQVTEALRRRGFDVMQGVAMRSQKQARDGSRKGGFQILGVSAPGLATMPNDRPDGWGPPLWWNVVLSEAGPLSTRVTSVDPLAVKAPSTGFAGPRTEGARRELLRIIAEL